MSDRISGASQIGSITQEQPKQTTAHKKMAPKRRFRPTSLGKTVNAFLHKRSLDKSKILERLTHGRTSSESKRIEGDRKPDEARISELELKASTTSNTAQFQRYLEDIISAFHPENAVPLLESRYNIVVENQSRHNISTSRIKGVIVAATSECQRDGMINLEISRRYLASVIAELKK